MAYSLGWKDVLRPIRDGYRHLFPAPDTGPTPEERRQKRNQDRLKGFTYFDTFEQLETWSEAESDPLQRANTPLLRRCEEDEDPKVSRAPLMLCHDYAGNYHDYEDARSISVDEPLYACEYLQYVDSFVYFSHKLICVPPPTWTNTLHRNGVKVFGTILLEPQTKDTERLLQHTGEGDEMKFQLTRKLADIARHYGFDGWLINIEKPFPAEVWSPDVFQAFLVQLRSELGDDMQLVWYDALTTSNEVYYQNGLNLSNLPYFEACGSMLTNYCWSKRQALDTAIIAASQTDLGPRKVFVGIDVWAQNATWFNHPRTTYPKDGGGGTNTGIAVAKAAEHRLSAGVFAPAWSFEHFPGHGREVERAIWEGDALPTNLTCSCGSTSSRHPATTDYAITRHAKVFPAGSENFLYTDMTRAFGMNGHAETEKLYENRRLHSQLGAQSILPLAQPPEQREKESCLSHRLESSSGQDCLVIDCHNGLIAENPTNRPFIRWLPLYRVNMLANSTLNIRILAENMIPEGADGVPSIYLKYSDEFDSTSRTGMNSQLISFQQHGKSSATSLIRRPSFLGSTARLEEIGFHLAGYSGAKFVPVLRIFEILITPLHAHLQAMLPSHKITNIHMEHRGEEENQHARLCWDMAEHVVAVAPRLEGMPYSDITGPFSYFQIQVHGLDLGRAYALEHVLSKEIVELIRNIEVEVQIKGFGFDGRQLADETATLRLESGN